MKSERCHLFVHQELDTSEHCCVVLALAPRQQTQHSPGSLHNATTVLTQPLSSTVWRVGLVDTGQIALTPTYVEKR